MKTADAVALSRGGTSSCTVDAAGPIQRPVRTTAGKLRRRAAEDERSERRTKPKGIESAAVRTPTYSRPRGVLRRQASARRPPHVAPSQPPAASIPPRRKPTRATSRWWTRRKNGTIQKLVEYVPNVTSPKPTFDRTSGGLVDGNYRSCLPRPRVWAQRRRRSRLR